MSDKDEGFVRGEPYNIKPSFVNPDRERAFGVGGGGGYIGNGSGWGLQEGPRRGQGGPGSIRNLPGPNVMSEFMGVQIDGQMQIDDEYNPRFSTLITDTERELEERKQAANEGGNFTVAESAAMDQKVALDLIDTKKSQYISTAPGTYALYGQSPYFLMEVLPRRKISEILTSPYDSFALYNSFGLFNNVYKSAMELKRLSLSMDVLAGKLAELARKRNEAESDTPLDDAALVAAQDQRLSTIALERDIHAQQLPEFLQTELIAAAGSLTGLTLTQTLTHYKMTLDRMAATKIAEMRPVQPTEPLRFNGITVNFTLNNPKINAPLSKPELEALSELVYLQNNTPLGTKWLSYHDALLKAESARHLTATSNAFSGLVERADEAEQTIGAIKLTADFYKEVTEKFGEKASALAKELSENAKGKKIRNAEEAIKAFDQYNDVLNKKFSVKDREAIAKAVDSLDKDMMAKSLDKFSKGFGLVGIGVDAFNILTEAQKSMKSGDWKPFFVKTESVMAGRAVGGLLAFTFGMTVATPLGILGFALLMAVTSSLIDDALVSKFNDFILSL
ncbi:colicin-like pore-forming protein [Pseudomonas sp. IT-P100]|uniref:colicin-like pore-forming protein n=1 Tax=Pseudomonas sp. IT-P100 TaxID=3026452 RepID=UPI0039DFF419